MTVRVRLFARARDLAGSDDLTLDLAAGATVGDLRRALAAECPALAGLVARSAFAVEDEFAGDEVCIAPGQEVALLPPVSGGTMV
jgi:molybdopterin converting factor subunit 1